MLALLRRLLLALGVWLGVATLTFAMMYMIPADPAKTMAGAQADPATVAAIRSQLGLDAPLPAQYVRYLSHALQGDFGQSYLTGENVLPTILERFPATLALALSALGVYLLVGVSLGIVGGVRPGGWGDRFALAVAALGVSVPTFWLGLVLLYLFAYKIPILPLGGWGSPAHLILPALTLGLGGAAYYIRLLRSGLADVMRADYIRMARAKGLSEPRVLFGHALKNASLPLLTLFGLDFAHLLGGAVLTESIFAWPGIGSNAMQAIANLDVPMIMGTVLFAATLIVVVNLVIDLGYGLLDPRLKGL